jgi:hypothetical protein
MPGPLSSRAATTTCCPFPYRAHAADPRSSPLGHPMWHPTRWRPGRVRGRTSSSLSHRLVRRGATATHARLPSDIARAMLGVERVGGAGRDRPKSRSAASDRPTRGGPRSGPPLMTRRKSSFGGVGCSVSGGGSRLAGRYRLGRVSGTSLSERLGDVVSGGTVPTKEVPWLRSPGSFDCR